MTLIMPPANHKTTSPLVVRLNVAIESRNDWERCLSRAEGIPDAAAELRRTAQESSLSIKKIENTTALERLLQRRQALIAKRQRISSGIIAAILPSNRQKRQVIDNELDSLSMEIYNLVNPRKAKDAVDSLLERANESFQKGLSLLQNGNQNTQI